VGETTAGVIYIIPRCYRVVTDWTHVETAEAPPLARKRMANIVNSTHLALGLLFARDPALLDIVALSLAVSLSASVTAAAIGLPLGAALVVFEFPSRSLLILIANAWLGLPPVVVGLALYLLLSRSGPLGSMGILFRPAAMVVAQLLLALDPLPATTP
jgi:tungstate transport system permease protein